jgi:hypothetical protein
MNAAENEGADHRSADSDPPLTVELLADLQAGTLDDEAAARVRRQVRADPQAAGVLAALNRVRREVAAVGADPAGPPDPPPQVSARIAAALRSAEPPTGGPAAHSARPHPRPARVIAAVAGLCAVLAAIGFGTVALLNTPEPAPTIPDDIQHITVSTPPMEVPLSPNEILGLLDRAPDFGPAGSTLSDPARRASCLTGLGYPAATQVLGARPVEINARPGIVLVPAGDSPHVLSIYAVSPNCSAADTGLLANTQVPRP